MSASIWDAQLVSGGGGMQQKSLLSEVAVESLRLVVVEAGAQGQTWEQRMSVGQEADLSSGTPTASLAFKQMAVYSKEHCVGLQ